MGSGLSLPPYPRTSIAATRYPAAASGGIWWRQEYQLSGHPCTSTISGPFPTCATRSRMPSVSTRENSGRRLTRLTRFSQPLLLAETGSQGGENAKWFKARLDNVSHCFYWEAP